MLFKFGLRLADNFAAHISGEIAGQVVADAVCEVFNRINQLLPTQLVMYVYFNEFVVQ